MEIFTLVKAGIRSRKGIMTGFMILTMVIVISVITMFGVRKNYESAINKAFEIENRGNIYAFFIANNFTDELRDEIEQDETVDHLDVIDCIQGVNVTANDKKDGNGYIVQKNMDTIPVFNEDSTELIIPGTPEYEKITIEKDEVYVPYGLKDRLNLKINDKLSMDFLGISAEFTVKGFVQECYMGSSIIGFKTVFINDEQFDELYDTCKKNIKDQKSDGWVIGKSVYVYPSEKANESSNLFIRDLTLNHKFSSMAQMDLTRETAEHYTGIYIKIILAVITGFSILLFLIFLIVAGHNISTEMEIDFVNLGILKSQGFTDKSIRLVYILQYLLVEFLGIIFGVIISIPLERWLSRLFFSLTAILPEKKLPVMEILIFSVLLFVITFIYINLCTRNVSKTTPVKAITNGKSDFYFDSRLNAPIKKNLLGLSLGFRQITSNQKRYISVCLVTSLLVFTVITCELMTEFIQSRNALISMGEPFLDIEYAFKNLKSECQCHTEDIENIVKKYAEIEGRFYRSHIYASVNGESIMVIVKGYPEELSSVYRGRDVKYENEIVVTEQVCKLLDVKLGDTVKVGRNEYAEDYVIVGIFQSMTDTGKCISMSTEGISRLKSNPEDKYTKDDLSMMGLVLKDNSEGQKIVDEVKEKYGDAVEIKFNDYNNELGEFGDMFYIAAKGSKILIYSLTFIFAIVTVAMVGAKAFIQERTDIGIYRAIGFKVSDVRRQFALRFMLICLISSAIGALISRLYSENVISLLFSQFGIPHVVMDYGPMQFIKPIVIFVVGYFVFGYAVSRKVKKVSSRELITE